MDDRYPWFDIAVSRWPGTKRTLHLCAQMLGKVKLAVAPMQPNWMFTALQLSPRGLTTGTIPWRGGSFDLSLDVFDSTIALHRSDGARIAIGLASARSVADVYSQLVSALGTFGIDCGISTAPQEIADTTPLDEDRRPTEYDADAARRWFAVATATAGVFDDWRSHFFGRSALAFWWGAFDLGLLLFSGRRAKAPTDRGYIMRYDLDAELMNAGLYIADSQATPMFYGYIYPEPESAESLPVAPATASWSSALREWVLPYDAVRAAAHPEAELRSFLDSIYEQCFAAAGWPRGSFEYDRPPR